MKVRGKVRFCLHLWNKREVKGAVLEEEVIDSGQQMRRLTVFKVSSSKERKAASSPPAINIVEAWLTAVEKT